MPVIHLDFKEKQNGYYKIMSICSTIIPNMVCFVFYDVAIPTGLDFELASQVQPSLGLRARDKQQ